VGDVEDEHVLVDPFTGGRLIPPTEVAERMTAAGYRSSRPTCSRR
jgi:hypothetical protein